MNVARYIAELEKRFDSQARTWPNLHTELKEISHTFTEVVRMFLNPDHRAFAAAIDQASDAHFRLARAHVERTSYRHTPFFDQSREFLNTLHRARLMGDPRLAVVEDLPQGNLLMYRGTTFLKGLTVNEEGRLAPWSFKNHSRNESAFLLREGMLHIVDTDDMATATVLFTVLAGEERLLLSVFHDDPLTLHCFVDGPSATILKTACDSIFNKNLTAWPAYPPIVPEGKDNYHAIHAENGRMRGGKRFNAPTLLAIASNRYWKFSRSLRLADIVRKLPKNGPSHSKGFDFLALCHEKVTIISSIMLGGYVTLYHLFLSESEADVFAFEGFGQVFLIGEDFAIGNEGRFRDRMTPYVEHFVDSTNVRNISPARIFYEIARALFRAAPPEKEAKGLALSYGNWRVGDCTFALTSIRQMADLGHDVEVLGQDSELLGFDPVRVPEEAHLRSLFGEGAMKRINFNTDYLDGLSDLLSANLGFAPGQRFRYQNRARAYGNTWQKIMFPEFSGRRQDLVLGWPTPQREATKAFGIFFTLDLEKRRWLEQETFLEELAVWCASLSVPVEIHINGMTSYRQPHRMGLPTIKTFVVEAGIVKEIEKRIAKRVPGFVFSSMAERSLDEKCRIIANDIHYCIGPLGSGTVVPSALYTKPSLIYSSNALYKINRDIYRNLDLLMGAYSELVPLDWVTDADARDHRIFPEAEMTNYSIPVDSVLYLAKAQITFHLRKQF